ncbi:MAG: DUF4271 domain-containing protein [Muribaculaceae bacterium]|nr:DUF4271 domain-containing protein [Muribaculaceae bacterium]
MALYDSIYNEVIIGVTAPKDSVFSADSALFDFSNIKAVETDTINFSSTQTDNIDSWHLGMEGASRQGSLIGNSGILSIIVLIFLLLSVNFKECSKLFSRFIGQLFNFRKKGEGFDEHTAHETRLTILMVIQFLIYSGIVLTGACLLIKTKSDGYIGDFTVLMKNIGILAVYYIFQLCAFGVLGYTFVSTDETRRFLRSLNASQSMCGIALMIPALLILFYPQDLETLVVIGGLIYLLGRLVFISNGFSIFYKNIFSLVYFILYLCALEIIPLIYVFKLALLI